MENIVSAPKTDMFRFRINPEIKKRAEDVSGDLVDETEVYRQLGVSEL